MEFKDIIVLVVAVIAWIYSSYRNFQKEAMKKAKKVSENKPETFEPAPTVLRTPTVRTVRPRQQIKEVKKSSVNSDYYASRGSLERKVTDISAKSSRKNVENEENFVVDKIKTSQNEFNSMTDNNSSVLEEIHSGKTDWRKAIILSEVIRPVYF